MLLDVGHVFTYHQEVETIVMFWTSFIIIAFLNNPILKIGRILLSELSHRIKNKYVSNTYNSRYKASNSWFQANNFKQN